MKKKPETVEKMKQSWVTTDRMQRMRKTQLRNKHPWRQDQTGYWRAKTVMY